MRIWLLALLACGALERGAPGAGAAPERSLTEAAHEVARQARVELDRCRDRVASRLDARAARVAQPEITPEDVDGGCGSGGRLYEALAARASESRDVAWVLSGLARVGDDAEFLIRELRAGPGDRLALAVDHIQDAVRQLDEICARVEAAQHVRPLVPDVVELPEGGFAARWAVEVEADRIDLGHLRELYERYAYIQGTNPELVRRRMLAHYGRVAGAIVRGHARVLDAGRAAGADVASAEAYQAACDALVAAYVEAADLYVAGKVRQGSQRDAMWSRLNAAHGAWEAAWARAVGAP